MTHEGLRLKHSVAFDIFFNTNLGKEEMGKKFNVGSKILERSYKFLKRKYPKEFAKKCADKYGQGKLGNKSNLGRMTVIIPKDELQGCLNKCMTKEAIKKHFRVSDFILDRNFEYHKLRDSYEGSQKKIPLISLIENKELNRHLEHLFPDLVTRLQDFNSDKQGTLDYLFEVHTRLNYIAEYVQSLGTRFNKRVDERTYSFTRNRGELYVAGLLYSLGLQFKMQYALDEYRYDFFIPSKDILIEVDGTSHVRNILNPSRDSSKDKIAIKHNKKLIRLKFSEKGVCYGEEKLTDELNKNS